MEGMTEVRYGCNVTLNVSRHIPIDSLSRCENTELQEPILMVPIVEYKAVR